MCINKEVLSMNQQLFNFAMGGPTRNNYLIHQLIISKQIIVNLYLDVTLINEMCQRLLHRHIALL